MRRYLIKSVIAAFFAGGLVTGWPAVAQDTVPTNTKSTSQDEIVARIDTYMKAAVANDQFTGAVLVARDGVPVVDTAYGMASYELGVKNTTRTVFHIASVTKQFTAMAIMQLRDRGKLNVDDAICKFLTDCPPSWKPITIRHLLTHTSGIVNVSSLPNWDEELSLKHHNRTEFVDLFRYQPLKAVPGEKYSYSNSGYFLLGQIIERTSGSTFEQFIKENIFVPLNMNQSSYDNNRNIVFGAASGYYSRGTEFVTATYVDPSARLGDTGIVSTTGDLLKWDQALYSEKLLTRRSIDEIFTPYKNGYGYGWEIGTRFSRKTYSHSGSDAGFSSYLLRIPEDRLTVIILGNGDKMSAGRAALNLAAIILGEPYKIPTRQLADEIWEAAIRGDIATATARFDQAKQEVPTPTDATSETLLDVGYGLVEAKRIAEAEAIFRFALQRFPNFAYAWDGLADSAIAREDQVSAIKFFNKSLKLDPSNEYAIKGVEKLNRQSKPPAS